MVQISSLAYREVSLIFCFRLFRFLHLSFVLFVFFFFFFHIFIHFHPLLSYGPNFKSLAHREVSLKSIIKFHSDSHTRKRLNKNMVKRALTVHRKINANRNSKIVTDSAENIFQICFVPLKEKRK